MPFFAPTSVVAVRQFCASLRTLPPSCRGDFELLSIASYDHSNYEVTDAFSATSIAVGSDEQVVKMIEQDLPFYAKGQIDRLPVNVEEK